MSVATTALPGLMQQRSFVLMWLVRLMSTTGYQMLVLFIGWKVYELTNSAFDLGLIGLIQFVPMVILTLLIGHLADRYDRRLILSCAQGVCALASIAIAVALITHTLSREILFAAAFTLGCARAFELPTAGALVPSLVPTALMPRAVASWSSANQIAIIGGPALGGLIYTLSPLAVPLLGIAIYAVSMTLVSMIKLRITSAPKREPPTFASVLAGFDYVRTRRRLLGVISLDLFVVLLGGATALLPVFARDILAGGPIGLGLLRAAPAVGALAIALLMSHYPIERHIGRWMFISVAVFGAATVVFGLSTWFPLSLAALAVLGAADSVSVVIRFSLVQIETPDDKRGRVSAINYLLVGSSNTLGEFESGTVAALIGAVPSVLIGGIGSLVVAAMWIGLFPDLAKLDAYEPADDKQQA